MACGEGAVKEGGRRKGREEEGTSLLTQKKLNSNSIRFFDVRDFLGAGNPSLELST